MRAFFGVLATILCAPIANAWETKEDAWTFEAAPPQNQRLELAGGEGIGQKAQTPWEAADFLGYSARGEQRNYYGVNIFSFFEPTPSKLRAVRNWFLRRKKCVAQNVEPPFFALKDDQGQAWPQTMFQGSCAAPEKFIVLTVIAGAGASTSFMSPGQ